MFYESDDYTTIKTSSEIFSHIFAILSPRLIKILIFQRRNMGNLRHYEGNMKDQDFRAFTIKGMKKNVAVSAF